MDAEHNFSDAIPGGSADQARASEVALPRRLSSVLLVDEDAGIRDVLMRGLEKSFGLVEAAEDLSSAEAMLQRCHFDLIIADIHLPGRSAVEWIGDYRQRGGTAGVFFMSADSSLETAVTALRAGAEDFIVKPFRIEQMIASVNGFLDRDRQRRTRELPPPQSKDSSESSGLVGECASMRDVLALLRQLAPMPSTVLIEGESGTGKELAAKAIHAWSRRSGSFVPVNCAAISAELIESELFGHVKGAFTGAHQAREGLLAYANGGTLFLDEIGEMPLPMQAHLLRVLEEHRVRPVGGNRQLPLDVRVIAATNRDLKREVKEGRFREDLFYRLDVVSLRMPALRERRDDIPVLAHHFAATLAENLGVDPPRLADPEISQLMSYDWPGNVRELKNVIERCLLLRRTPSQCVAGFVVGSPASEVLAAGDDELLLETVEKRHILKVLALAQGNKSAAARQLGISRKTLERKARVWGL